MGTGSRRIAPERHPLNQIISLQNKLLTTDLLFALVEQDIHGLPGIPPAAQLGLDLQIMPCITDLRHFGLNDLYIGGILLAAHSQGIHRHPGLFSYSDGILTQVVYSIRNQQNTFKVLALRHLLHTLFYCPGNICGLSSRLDSNQSVH